MTRRHSQTRISRVITILALFAALPVAAQTLKSNQLQSLRFRFLGPVRGNRVSAVIGEPGNPNVYYVGAASGGIFKSTDGGNRWLPIFDKEPAQSIGALAIAPSHHEIVWAGTGEPWVIRDKVVVGDGVYKSMDAGKTWEHMGLEQTGRIARIVIDPRNPDLVLACAEGRGTGPQPERGIYRTTDGGKTWTQVLFADKNTGCSGLSMSAKNPRFLVAGTWQFYMHPWIYSSGGPGSGVYVSHDEGVTWHRIEGHGLPHSPVGKIDVAIAPSDPSRVYALIETKDQGSVWRSDDGGERWQVVNYSRLLTGRAGYYIRIAVSPTNENEVYIASSSFWESTDGAETFHSVRWGGDNHDIWVDPTNPDRIMVSDDGGVNITTVHGKGFHRVSLPIGQMYHVAVDHQVPYYVYGNMQDDGSMRAPSTSGVFGFGYGASAETGWQHGLGGCESGFTLPDPANPDIVWASCYGDEVSRWNAKNGYARSVSPWPQHPLDSAPQDTKYRCHWTPPLAIDPFDPNTVYYGCQVVFKTSNGGQSWSVISPDLSLKDPSKLVNSGGLRYDNLGQFYGEVVFAIAPSPAQKGLIWAGTNDGQVWYTRNGGGHWTNVTKNIPDLPPLGVVSSIEPSSFDAATAYVSIDLHLMDDYAAFIYKTTDYGKTWKRISDGIPKSVFSYVNRIAEDPNKKGLLFAGTENGVYYSPDDGGNWVALTSGLPHAPVSWLVVQKRFHDLVISTYGRGFWILDDITPLGQMSSEVLSSPAHLFTPRPAYRFLRGARGIVDYYLQKPAPKNGVKLEILDSHGNLVDQLRRVGDKAGLNRVFWRLRYASPRLIKLRTSAPDNPHIWDEIRFRGKDSRPILHWGIQGGEIGPLAGPGDYTVRLTVGGQNYTQKLTILKDPHSSGSDANIQASLKITLQIRDDISAVSDMTNQIEWMRKQLDDVRASLAGRKDQKATVDAIDGVNQKMLAVENRLVAPALRNSDQKQYIEAYKLYLNFVWLAAAVGTGGGDVAGSADYPPTDQQLEVFKLLEKQLAAVRADYRNLMKKEVPAFNRKLVEQNITPLVSQMPPEPADSASSDGASADSGR
jgi:photosystem II stability/assembly factor-like uncharacterized protein